MTNFLEFLQVCAIAVGVFALFRLSSEIRAIRNELSLINKRFQNPVSPPHLSVSENFAYPVIIYGIWVWKNQNWELDQKSVPPGYDAGAPPEFSGSYEGQRVKKDCTKL